MSKKFVKIALLLLMVAGVCFSAFNFLAVKSEAAVYWQDLKLGKDPILGTPSVTCLKTGQACVTVSYPR
jgi:hypothetical protein